MSIDFSLGLEKFPAPVLGPRSSASGQRAASLLLRMGQGSPLGISGARRVWRWLMGGLGSPEAYLDESMSSLLLINRMTLTLTPAGDGDPEESLVPPLGPALG